MGIGWWYWYRWWLLNNKELLLNNRELAFRCDNDEEVQPKNLRSKRPYFDDDFDNRYDIDFEDIEEGEN